MKNIIFWLAAVIILVGCVCTGVFFIWRAKTVDTYELTVENISITYGDEVPLDKFKVDKIMKSNKKYAIAVTREMIKYNSELIGEQTATLSYGGVEKQFLLTIAQRQLATAKLSMNNGLLEWDAVEDATAYLVWINGKSTQTTDMQFSLLEHTTQAQTYKVSVQAISSDSRFSASELTAEIECTKLKNASNIKVENNILKWDSVENAIKYNLEIGGKTITLTELEYDIGATVFEVGSNTIKIKAVANKTGIIPSVTTFEIIKLASPTLSMKDGVLSLSSVPLASSYESVCGANTYVGQSKDFSKIVAGSYTAKGKAIGNGANILDSDVSLAYRFSKNSAITGIEFRKINQNLHVTLKGLPTGAEYSITIMKYMSDSTQNSHTWEKQTDLSMPIGIDNVVNIVVKIIVRGNGEDIIDSDIFEENYNCVGI